MIIDISSLNYGKEVNINDSIVFNKSDLENTDLLDLKDVKVNGYIKVDDLDSYVLNLNVKGTMVIPCSRTLVPTNYDFDINIEENIMENEKKLKKTQKTIDILPIIWENILMEIPIKIINPKAEGISLKGEGWELITDSEE